MEYFTLLKREIKEPLRPLLIFVSLSGLCDALLLAIINNTAASIAN